MSWLVDNANGLYTLLAIVATGFVVAWRFNGRVKFLGYAGAALVVLLAVWLMTRFVTTDRKHLENNVLAMARAVEECHLAGLFRHISKDFRYGTLTRELLYDAAQDRLRDGNVKNIRISQFRAEEVSRDKKFAKTSFLVAAEGQRDILFRVEGDFVLEGNDWKLKTLRFYPPFANATEEIPLPGLRQ